MTEKDVYKKGVALLEEWEDVNYCEHSFKFKDEWLTDKEVVDLLNELAEENDVLKQQLKTKHIVNKQYEELQRLKEENKELKQNIEVFKMEIAELREAEKDNYNITDGLW